MTSIPMHRVGGSEGDSGLVCERYSVRFSIGVPVILSEVFMGFPHPLQANVGAVR